MIEFIITLLSVVIVGALCGLWQELFQSVIGRPSDKDGPHLRSIFSFYGVWLDAQFKKVESPVDEYIDGRGGESALTDKQRMHVAKKINIFMALGWCPYCNNVWSSAIISAILFHNYGLSLFWILLVIPVSHFVLGLVEK